MLTYEEMLRMPRPVSGHLHMDQRNRAKQFAPFDALRGFGASIRERAVVYSPRPVLCEDRKEEIERALAELCVGDEVMVVYFREFVPGKDERFNNVIPVRKTGKEEEGCQGTMTKKQETEMFPPRKLQTDRKLSGMGQFETVTGTLCFLEPGSYMRVEEEEIPVRDIVRLNKET